MRKTQTDEILEWLEKGHELSPLEALERFRCFRLAARIYDIRKLGYEIEERTEHANGKHFAVYRLKEAIPFGGWM